MRKLVIIHTTLTTTASLPALAKALMPTCEVVNIVDDSLLTEVVATGGKIENIEGRVRHYVHGAEHGGAHVILLACPSLGELIGPLRQQATATIVRIDDAMAAEAVRRAQTRIGVVATLSATLEPTVHLILRRAKELHKKLDVEPIVIPAAHQQLLRDDRAGHDALVMEAVAQLAPAVDVILFTQPTLDAQNLKLPTHAHSKWIDCAQPAMERVKLLLEGTGRLILPDSPPPSPEKIAAQREQERLRVGG
jgi:hypothetical protein